MVSSVTLSSKRSISDSPEIDVIRLRKLLMVTRIRSMDLDSWSTSSTDEPVLKSLSKSKPAMASASLANIRIGRAILLAVIQAIGRTSRITTIVMIRLVLRVSKAASSSSRSGAAINNLIFSRSCRVMFRTVPNHCSSPRVNGITFSSCPARR